MARLSRVGEELKGKWLSLLRLIFTFLLIISSPIIIVTFGAISFYRFIVFRLAKYFDPNLGKMMSSMSNFFGAHDIYNNSYTTNIALHVAGKIDKWHIISAFEKLLEANNSKDGILSYPELKQRVVAKLGFTFWKNVTDFKVEDHIHYYTHSSDGDPDTPLTLHELHEAIARFGKTPLNPTQSPWEVFIVKNLASDKTLDVKSAIILRFHHCMFDGHSVLNVFSKMADNGPFVLEGKSVDKHSVPKIRRLIQMMLRPFLIFFVGPYQLVGQMMSYDNNELIKISKSEFKSEMRFKEVEPFHLGQLRQIKNHFGVGFNTLISAMIVGALKKLMVRKLISADKINMTFPVPLKEHPDKLRNYFSAGIITIDMRAQSRLELLQEVEKKSQQFRLSYAVGLPEVNLLILRILGSLPSVFVPRLDNVPTSSTLMHSCFPGPVGLGYFSGFPVLDATVAISTLAFSYNGMLKIGLSADISILTHDEAELLATSIYDEFLAFQREMAEIQVQLS